MQFVFGYAGIPAGEAFDYIKKKSGSLTGGGPDFVGHPLSKGDNGLSEGHAKKFLRDFRARLNQDFDHKRNFFRTGCAVIYVRDGDCTNKAFESHFFPAVLPVPVDWTPSGVTPDERRAAEKTLFETLLRTTVRTREVLKILHLELTEKANKTPLLLPIRNFESKRYDHWLRSLQSEIAAASDEKAARVILAQAIQSFEVHHPRVKGSGAKRSFHDDRDIEFRAPGIREMHGVPHINDAHPSELCLLAAFRRLGAPFNAAFHFDAQKDAPKNLKGFFCQCHGQHGHVTGNPHINIAPNDFIRL